MFKDKEKIEFIEENIENIEKIVERHNGIVNALKDRVEAKPAILMALLQIGETLNKLHNKYDLINNEDIKGAYEVRNFIAHDYMGVDIALIELIIREKLPDLKNAIKLIYTNTQNEKKDDSLFGMWKDKN